MARTKTKKIPLTQGFFAIVDADQPDELEWIFSVSWYAHKSNARGTYARNRTHGFLHRVIAKTPRHLDTDHLNRDTLDNRRENLRNCSHKTNCKNRDYRKGRSKTCQATN